MRILFATMGTRGDVQPPLALAKTLVARGHDVTLVAPPDFGRWIEQHGVRHRALGFDIQAWVKENEENIGSVATVMREMFALMAKNVAAEFIVLGEEMAAHDVIVTSSLVTAGPTVAAVEKKPYFHLAFVPTILPSDTHAPFFVPWRDLPRALNKVAWWLAQVGFNRPLRGPLNARRRELGLPPIGNVIDHLITDTTVLLAVDEVLAAMVSAPGVSFRQVPSLVLDDPSELSDDVRAFLDDGDPPVYIGFGSMPDSRPEETAAHLLRAVREVGCRALIARGWSGLGMTGSDDANVLVVGAEPHGKLFPRCAAIVHHGGAGTTTTALRAGVPQVVVPFSVDQPDWGLRVFRAGLGPPPLPKRKLNAERLAAALHQCLDGGEMAANARAAAARIAEGPGNEAAAEILENLVTRA